MLFHSIRGKGVFRRFRTVLQRLGLVDEWYQFREQKLREFVEYWCRENRTEFEQENSNKPIIKDINSCFLFTIHKYFYLFYLLIRH